MRCLAFYGFSRCLQRAELNYCIAWCAGNAENIQKTKPVVHPLQRAELNYCIAWYAGNAENIN